MKRIDCCSPHCSSRQWQPAVPAWLTTRTRNIDGRLGRDGFKIRISTYANDRQEIDFAPIAGNNISSFHVQGERRGNRLISLMVRCRYRT
jgi:hypothetical protein